MNDELESRPTSTGMRLRLRRLTLGVDLLRLVSAARDAARFTGTPTAGAPYS